MENPPPFETTISSAIALFKPDTNARRNARKRFFIVLSFVLFRAIIPHPHPESVRSRTVRPSNAT